MNPSSFVIRLSITNIFYLSLFPLASPFSSFTHYTDFLLFFLLFSCAVSLVSSSPRAVVLSLQAINSSHLLLILISLFPFSSPFLSHSFTAVTSSPLRPSPLLPFSSYGIWLSIVPVFYSSLFPLPIFIILPSYLIHASGFLLLLLFPSASS